jgi:3-methyl-2-oxobutanoate hydroxymethyltransferase
MNKNELKEKQTITKIMKSKNQSKIVMITAYDTLFAKLFEEIADIILVGDSLNNSFRGEDDTLSITLDQMIYHAKAVCKGAPNTFVVMDMPFGTYSKKNEALKNAIKVYRETNVAAVKIEGGKDKSHIIKYLTQNSIAVVGHIGLMPQYVRSEGGYKVRGKTPEDIEQLICDAKAVEEAGAFCLVVEGVKSETTKIITNSINIPTIGIGSGKYADGQVIVWSDMLGFFEDYKPKFVRKYLDGANLIRESVKQYCHDVKKGTFPSKEESY